MVSRKFSLAVTATAALACAAALMPFALSSPAAAQANPTMTNVVPDGGQFAAQGKIQALDPGALTLTLAPQSGSPLPMTVAPGVDLTNVSVGDVANVHYKRSVTFVEAPRTYQLATSRSPAPWSRSRNPVGLDPMRP